MKNILKAIGAGLALGLAFFLFPFVGRLLLFFLLVKMAFRLMRGGRRGGPWGRRFGYGRGGAFGPMADAPVPIDNQWYQPTVTASGPRSYVPVA
jgi:hypothetical protein